MSKHRVLVIEDNPHIADLVCHVATDANFDVRATSDFMEITSLYDEFAPHIIVLDVVMPDMDGFEVLNFLHKRNSSSRIIILSGEPAYYPMASRMAEGLELAIIATVEKPFRVAELRQMLEQIKLSLPTSNGDSSPKAA
jgi:two-component system OmpR family response regulator